MQPFVSVLLATYNDAPYIEHAVNSILEQSYDHFELIIIDDGSTDRTPASIEPYGRDNRVSIINQTNEGLAGARNAGLAVAKGEFIAFCDGDDLWHRDKLKLQIPVLANAPDAGLVHTARTAIDENGNAISRAHKRSGRIIVEKNTTQSLLHRNYICGSSSLIRRECFDQIGLFDTRFRLSCDHQLFLRMSTRYKFVYLDEELYLYRKHSAQANSNRSLRDEYRERVLKDFAEHFPDAISRKDFDIAFANIHKTRGHERLMQDDDRPGAREEFLKALKYRPINPSVWFRYLRTWT